MPNMNGHSMIQELRAREFTQKQIADELGCSQASVHAWENGDRGTVRGISGNYLMRLIEMHSKHCGNSQVHGRAA
jgi:predicted transcriptional regulator